MIPRFPSSTSSTATDTDVLRAIAEGEPPGRVFSRLATLASDLLGNGVVCAVVAVDDRGRLIAWSAGGVGCRVAAAFCGVSVAPDHVDCPIGAGDKPVIVRDLAADPRMRAWASVPLELGLIACWAFPVTVRGARHGTVVIYLPWPAQPTPAERVVVDRLVALAGAAFGREAMVRELAQLDRRRADALRQALHATERVRTRLAADLHDDTVQVLTAAMMCLDRAAAASDDHRLALIAQSRETLGHAIDRVRRLMFDLRPDLLRASGLAPALSELASAAGDGAAFVVDLDVCARRYPAPIETIAYRTVSEALTNIRKHAGAGRVQIAIKRCRDHLVGTIRDDGAGFDPARAAPCAAAGVAHIGLHSMRERVVAAGGELAVCSAPGRGTTVRFRLPLTGSGIAA